MAWAAGVTTGARVLRAHETYAHSFSGDQQVSESAISEGRE